MSRKIQQIYVCGYKYDIQYARCCVASVRHWYPDISITLIKDRFYGEYYTKDIEKYWNVNVLDVQERVFNWGFSKFEPLFLPKKEKVLILDADTLFVGRILDLLQEFDEEFIVSGTKVTEEFQNEQYFKINDLEKFDPDYMNPGYAFNTGQFVATTGIFDRKDFEKYVEWDNPPKLKQEDLFQCGEQGLLNYFLFKQNQLSRISLKSIRFMETADNPLVNKIKEHELVQDCSKKLIIHWAGLRRDRLIKAVNGRLLLFFENYFYSKLKHGKIKQFILNRLILYFISIKRTLKCLFLVLKK